MNLSPRPPPPPPKRKKNPTTTSTLKLRSAFRKMNTITHMLNRSTSAPTSSISSAEPEPKLDSLDDDVGCDVSDRMLTLYVGRSRRAYSVGPELLDHPIMQELVERSDGSGEISVACEVVLFEHLCWMIRNSDPKVERFDELVDFYSNDNN